MFYLCLLYWPVLLKIFGFMIKILVVSAHSYLYSKYNVERWIKIIIEIQQEVIIFIYVHSLPTEELLIFIKL